MHTFRAVPFLLKFLSLNPFQENHRGGSACLQKLDQKANVFNSAEAGQE